MKAVSPPYLSNQTAFRQALGQLNAAHALSVNSQGCLIPEGFFSSLFRRDTTSNPRLIELKVIELLVQGKKWLIAEDLKLIEQLACKAGLIKEKQESVDNHKELALLIHLISKEILQKEMVRSKEYSHLHKAFLTNYQATLAPFSSLYEQPAASNLHDGPIKKINSDSRNVKSTIKAALIAIGTVSSTIALYDIYKNFQSTEVASTDTPFIFPLGLGIATLLFLWKGSSHQANSISSTVDKTKTTEGTKIDEKTVVDKEEKDLTLSQTQSEEEKPEFPTDDISETEVIVTKEEIYRMIEAIPKKVEESLAKLKQEKPSSNIYEKDEQNKFHENCEREIADLKEILRQAKNNSSDVFIPASNNSYLYTSDRNERVDCPIQCSRAYRHFFQKKNVRVQIDYFHLLIDYYQLLLSLDPSRDDIKAQKEEATKKMIELMKQSKLFSDSNPIITQLHKFSDHNFDIFYTSIFTNEKPDLTELSNAETHFFNEYDAWKVVWNRFDQEICEYINKRNNGEDYSDGDPDKDNLEGFTLEDLERLRKMGWDDSMPLDQAVCLEFPELDNGQGT
jgi:hypothetical protein